MDVKITVNGREYDGVEAMPPEVRSVYEGALKAVGPAGADKDGSVAEGRKGPVPLIQTHIVINKQTFRGRDEMPPELRQLYERVTKAGADPTGQGLSLKSGIKVTLTKPVFRFSLKAKDQESEHRGPSPTIEPSSAESGIRFALLAAAGLVGSIILAWVLFAK
jgi:hypothetical protein